MLVGAAKFEDRCAKQEAFLKEQQASLDKRKELSESSLTGGAALAAEMPLREMGIPTQCYTKSWSLRY